ncbi:MAG: EamA family transporter [Candidatus Moranbacteria bacterium]|nr:EamA family transporter [Candidatus Moranbacteria bacterium]
MNWKIACFAALVMWSTYGFFAERAGKIHGEKINLIFETLAFIVLALIAVASGIGDIKKITTSSAIHASVMGLLSAGGFWFILYAFKVVPQQETFLVLLISGIFPVLAAVISNFLVAPLSIYQWLGVAMAGGGLILVSWK